VVDARAAHLRGRDGVTALKNRSGIAFPASPDLLANEPRTIFRDACEPPRSIGDGRSATIAFFSRFERSTGRYQSKANRAEADRAGEEMTAIIRRTGKLKCTVNRNTVSAKRSEMRFRPLSAS